MITVPVASFPKCNSFDVSQTISLSPVCAIPYSISMSL